MWLLSGSVSLGTWFGIHVRVHAFTLVVAAFFLITNGLGNWTDTLTAMGLLFIIVLLHEFGHCFGSRLVGGQPTEILMHPLGGLASAGAPRRPWPTFFTVLAGPLVNVVICLLMAAAMMGIRGSWHMILRNPLNLSRDSFLSSIHASTTLYYYCSWIYSISYGLLLFNLLPIFPLDGGQMLQSILWWKIGYYRATYFAAVTGMIGSAVAAAYGLVRGNGFLLFIAILGFQVCIQMYRELKANGPWAYQDEMDYGFGGAYGGAGTATARKLSARKIRKAKKLEREAEAEQERIDAILAKVSAHGMQSLSWFEKRALKKATKHQRERDMELARSRRS
jgi:Zn-dependent protease